MTEEEALLAAIIAAPDDNTVRLVYADWLDEHGGPVRAELIRKQCQLEGMSDRNLGDREFRELSDRVNKLKNQAAAEYRSFEKDGIKVTEWERGLPVEIEMRGNAKGVRPSPEALVTAFETICSLSPIKRVRIMGGMETFTDNQIQALGESKAWHKIDSVRIMDVLVNQGFFLNSPHFKEIKQIDLIQDNVEQTQAALQEIAQNRNLENLKILDCSSHEPNGDYFGQGYRIAMEEVAGSANLPKLQEIRLNEGRCRPHQIERINTALAEAGRGGR